ncbi:hypothetical protein EMIT0111MI5_90257 [Burkholderia sp. IT-111MI5]
MVIWSIRIYLYLHFCLNARLSEGMRELCLLTG